MRRCRRCEVLEEELSELRRAASYLLSLARRRGLEVPAWVAAAVGRFNGGVDRDRLRSLVYRAALRLSSSRGGPVDAAEVYREVRRLSGLAGVEASLRDVEEALKELSDPARYSGFAPPLREVAGGFEPTRRPRESLVDFLR